MANVYILYSALLEIYYTGFTTESTEVRLHRHNSDYYENKFTSNGKPWSLYLAIACTDEVQARAIEKHIKSMKSKKYIENLKQYPEMREKLLTRFKNS